MRILYVMATELEYGPHLRRRIAPLICGVGPVEAAVTVAAELARRQATGAAPRLVVSLGSAGSRTLVQTEVYQASTVTYRDMDASALGFPRGQTPFLDLAPELPVGPQLAGVPQARLSTGASVVSGAAYGAIDADMVDMETYAILRACQRHGIPLLALRGISDGAEDLRQLKDWTQYLEVIDAKLAALVDRIEDEVAKGRFP
ncbi:5'-methylthioadenosine/S-adenosylhomocysteine nucleosidase [Pararhodobacter sp. SW119]|uniref:5'-methylthioadenosine/S-adenosylhomocysteine nucleosidase n=1 Tax=Pararhodobacter sp. SW119 TaxID=2780075 RepID=UPI001ADFCF58|nr:5'-methylthioadenosine/S-adenosylhomocysteine nucleosidase [Pararhodobacter sp. SW119]